MASSNKGKNNDKPAAVGSLAKGRLPADREAPGDGGESGRKRGWWGSKGPVFRFVVSFSVMMSVFAVFFFAYFTNTVAFDAYLRLNADVSARLLRLMGDDATAAGFSVTSARASVQIKHGCDAIFPSALFVGAVLASPVRFRSKIGGMFIGSVVLLTINLIRIITLYYTRIYAPDYFHMMHIDVWQPAFIFLSLLFWVLWALRATRPPIGVPHGGT